MGWIRSFLDQIRRHSVALISLVVAVTSLGYNTWRNEVTEENRNIRSAGFELIHLLAELDLVVFRAYWQGEGGSHEGWARVLAIRDLGEVLPAPVQAATMDLHAAWDSASEAMIAERDPASYERIDTAIDSARAVALETLRSLD